MKRLSVMLCLLLCGCKVVTTGDNIVSAKATVFGLDISNDPVTKVPHIRVGLVRYFYQVIPTGTNRVYAAPYSSDVDAAIGIANQKAVEKFSTVNTNQ
jgi:hypothetical protein